MPPTGTAVNGQCQGAPVVLLSHRQAGYWDPEPGEKQASPSACVPFPQLEISKWNRPRGSGRQKPQPPAPRPRAQRHSPQAALHVVVLPAVLGASVPQRVLGVREGLEHTRGELPSTPDSPAASTSAQQRPKLLLCAPCWGLPPHRAAVD